MAKTDHLSHEVEAPEEAALPDERDPGFDEAAHVDMPSAIPKEMVQEQDLEPGLHCSEDGRKSRPFGVARPPVPIRPGAHVAEKDTAQSWKTEQKSKLSRMEISWIMMDSGLDKAAT